MRKHRKTVCSSSIGSYRIESKSNRVYVGEGACPTAGNAANKKGERGWKIEIKGRWVIAVAWEAAQDKSNRSSNHNATPSSDHERKNPHGKSPGINSVPRLEPVLLIGPIPWGNMCSFFYPLPISSPHPQCALFPCFLVLVLPLIHGGPSSCSMQLSSNFKLTDNLDVVESWTFFAFFYRESSGRVELLGGYFDKDVSIYAENRIVCLRGKVEELVRWLIFSNLF